MSFDKLHGLIIVESLPVFTFKKPGRLLPFIPLTEAVPQRSAFITLNR